MASSMGMDGSDTFAAEIGEFGGLEAHKDSLTTAGQRKLFDLEN